MYSATYGNSDLYEYGRLLRAYTGWSNFSSFFNLTAIVLAIIGMWNMFIKAGEPGWGALIPYYRTYLLFKIADMKKAFWVYLVATVGMIILTIAFLFIFIGVLASLIGNGSGVGLASSFVLVWVLMFAAIVTVFVLAIMLSINLAKVFNLSGGYAVGIFFLPFVFYMIIGLSKNIRYKNQFAGSQGFNGQGYGQNPYQQNSYGQSPYGNSYQQNSYGQNPYGNPYQQNPYAQNNSGQDPYAQNQYSQTTYAQNAYDQNMNQQNVQNPQAQNPYAQPPKEDVWKTIYDDDSNNLNQ